MGETTQTTKEPKFLVALVPLFSPDQLIEALDIVVCGDKLDPFGHRNHALVTLANRLTEISAIFPKIAWENWFKILPELTNQPRPDFLNDLESLMPFVLSFFSEDERQNAAQQIFCNIQEICQWWP
jgi:hypothetical protein